MRVPAFIAFEKEADREGFPVPWDHEGSQGKGYGIAPEKLKTWFANYEAIRQGRKDERDAVIASLFPEDERVAALCVQFGHDPTEKIPPDLYKQFVDIALAELKLKREAGDLVAVSEAYAMIAEHHKFCLSVIKTAQAELFRALNADPERRAQIRKIFDDAQRAAAETLERSIPEKEEAREVA